MDVPPPPRKPNGPKKAKLPNPPNQQFLSDCERKEGPFCKLRNHRLGQVTRKPKVDTTTYSPSSLISTRPRKVEKRGALGNKSARCNQCPMRKKKDGPRSQPIGSECPKCFDEIGMPPWKFPAFIGKSQRSKGDHGPTRLTSVVSKAAENRAKTFADRDPTPLPRND